MMKKIYILCPSHTKTGGTELLHQLFFELREQGYNAFLAYTNYEGDGGASFEPFSKYVKFPAISSEFIEDTLDSVIVFPEIYYKLVCKYKNAKKIIWWLSVDFFLQENSFIDRLRIKGFLSAFKNCLLGNLKNKISYIKNADYHFCQSYYAIDFLKKKGIDEKKIFYLSDYVNDLYLNNINTHSERKNVVLFNPKKGYKFTRKLIKCARDIEWIPLINMTNDQVNSLMLTSKVYIDFGNHPGKDRIPREAAISGCCVITGKRGAAAFYEDVPIPNSFKFDEKKREIGLIISKIHQCFDDFEGNNAQMQEYRNMIIQEKEKFKKDIKNVFEQIM